MEQSFEKIVVPSIENLITKLNSTSWLTDSVKQIEIAADLTALLCSFNTVNGSGNDFWIFTATIRRLLDPLINNRFANFKIFSDKEGLPLIAISSNGIEHDISNLESAPLNYLGISIHAHFDTFQTDSFDTFLSTQDNAKPELTIIKGRGVLDMKGQIAAYIMSLYRLYLTSSKSQFFFILTSEEESGLKNQGEYLTKLMRSVMTDPDISGSVNNALVTDLYWGQLSSIKISSFLPMQLLFGKHILTSCIKEYSETKGILLTYELIKLSPTRYEVRFTTAVSQLTFYNILNMLSKKRGNVAKFSTESSHMQPHFTTKISPDIKKKIKEILLKTGGSASVSTKHPKDLTTMYLQEKNSASLYGDVSTGFVEAFQKFSKLGVIEANIALLASLPTLGAIHTSNEATLVNWIVILSKQIVMLIESNISMEG